MTSRSDALPRSGNEAGFTLIEMIVVLAIVALIVSMITINGRPISPSAEARAAAEAISGALRAARGAALASNRSVSFVLDLGNRSYRWGRHAPQSLPGDLGLALLTGRDEVAAGRVGRIRFDPDGGASGGRVTVAGGGRVWWVGVDWLSGRVSLAEKVP